MDGDGDGVSVIVTDNDGVFETDVLDHGGLELVDDFDVDVVTVPEYDGVLDVDGDRDRDRVDDDDCELDKDGGCDGKGHGVLDADLVDDLDASLDDVSELDCVAVADADGVGELVGVGDGESPPPH